ncbi:hypothetical protein UK23_06320 [Lentzea aerocolonigenes]|uniref:Chorismate-utilising enzyme C-terminal domain-containing protein n=1 Tax=Lentzea aerocolonigenes TaxID=68170 RepID=A0A0F0H7V7_LENAE|nr:chorismate-binding protein [Lentzea aerocolonigenes]KJK51585.1 hypothetical protein UK23_06320 [Lentzea aerocolonigenes]
MTTYWERACHFFRTTGLAGTAGSYFIHNKNEENVKIGVRPRLSVSVDESSVSLTAGGRRTVAPRLPGELVFGRVRELLLDSAPYFFLVSPDLRRPFADPGHPQVLLVQPAVEFTFSPEHADGTVSHGHDGAALLQAAAQTPPVAPRDLGEPGPFAELATGWVPAEDDSAFLRRLVDAVEVLQGHPDGKVVLTRAYERKLGTTNDPFALYESHARNNGEYACSHYFCVRPGVFSLGVTPENVLETRDTTLTVDVVAATCAGSDDDAFVARELYENPKQVREHRSSLVNRQNRFRPFCAEGSIRVVTDMRVKRLRNVCHLHSVFTGELLPGVTVFDLLEPIFPLLGARPKELLVLADAEKAPHRYYGGVVGHGHGRSASCFLNIRNALLDHDTIHAKVGVGVIKESDPHSELVETRDKLSGLLEAIVSWERSVQRE